MTFQEAAAYVMPFGKYHGKTLDVIATSDSGLLYLDWLRGEREGDGRADDIDLALAAYLDDPDIKRDLQDLLSD